MIKQVRHYSEVQNRIVKAVDTITDPIKQTISPKGGNVLFEKPSGEIVVTNDGVTIAKSIEAEDGFEKAIINVIKQSALKTNSQAGDGTSTTILLSSILVKEGLKLVENGMNQMDVVAEYKDFADKMKGRLKKMAKTVKTDEDLHAIAKISANNDGSIAENVVKTVKVAGEDGMVFLESSNSADTEIVEDTGFIIEKGMFTPELANQPNGSATYIDVPVLITDKRIYYAQEAESILNTCLKNGYREVVIIAKDFIGEALPFFVANHAKGVIRSLLVKDLNVEKTNGVSLDDLAVYLGGEVISERSGSIVDNLQIENFVIARRVFADGVKTILSRDKNEPNPELDARIKNVKSELKKLGDTDSDEQRELKRRLASLTNGVVTIRIGGSTPIEVQEKVFRYEDAVSATRAAMKDGYLIGGGISVWRAFHECKFKGEMSKVFRKVAEANIRQIAENCGLHGDTVLDTIVELSATEQNQNVGYNALTDQFSDLLEDGVIDPYKVTEMAIDNAVSIAGAIISSRYMNVYVKESKNGDSTEESK